MQSPDQAYLTHGGLNYESISSVFPLTAPLCHSATLPLCPLSPSAPVCVVMLVVVVVVVVFVMLIVVEEGGEV
ncbi:hypothetical protein E2C01_097360 [Portunus trituberculatus]|uniref:Uncharacterized protein n=1 Tax=Portunus trituberculatus TaxID=210409 RepID=A0A5B7KB25_PORTR|nr:hypothetical protein [Portunus trituberculatus]